MSSRHRYRLLTAHELASLSSVCDETICAADAVWARAAMREWGVCGVSAWAGEKLIGFVLISPAFHLPNGHPYLGSLSQYPMLIAAWVESQHRGSGLGTAMVQRFCGAVQLEFLDAVSASRVTIQTPPQRWLEHCGFIAKTATPTYVLLRLDLRRGIHRWVKEASRHRILSPVRRNHFKNV